MGSQVERELSDVRLRLFLFEKLFWDFYMRAAPNTVAQSRQNAADQAKQFLETLGAKLESEFRKSETAALYHFVSADHAVKKLHEQIDELKKLIPNV